MLKNEGLDHWIEKIKTILELPNFKLLKYATREEFDKVLNSAKPLEKRALLSVFKRVVEPTEIDNSPKSAICKLFNDAGLDDKVWVPKVEQTFTLASINLLTNVERDEFLKGIAILTESPEEQTSLKRVYQNVLSVEGNELTDDTKQSDLVQVVSKELPTPLEPIEPTNRGEPTDIDNSNESAIREFFNDTGLDDKVWVPKVEQTFELASITLLKDVKSEKFLKGIAILTESLEEQTSLKQVYQNVLSLEGNELIDDTKQSDSVQVVSKELPTALKPTDSQRNPDNVEPKSATLSAAEAFRSVQGGLLSRGIYLAGDIDELDREREPVINVTDNFEFKGPCLASETCHREFTSETLTENFQSSIDINRASKSASGGLSFWGIDVNVDGRSEKDKNTGTREQSNKTVSCFASSMHYQLVPVRSFHITKADIVLRPDVVQMLQRIERDLKKSKYKPNGQFKEFFKTYGSHVNYGIVELGGILMSTAQCTGFKEENREKVTEMTKTVSEASLKLGFSNINLQIDAALSGSAVHSHTTETFNESELEQISFTLKKY